MKYLLLLLIAVFSLNGCYLNSTSPYPEKWGKIILEKDFGCVDISGIYNGRGEDFSHPDRPISFHFLLFEKRIKVSHIQISHPDENRIDFFLWDGTRLIDQKRYVRGKDYTCTNTEVDFFKRTEVVGENALGVVGYQYLLMKAEDGSLIIKQNSGGIGLLFGVAPMGGVDVQWYRFSGQMEGTIGNVDG